jgi:hypothetical protein
MEVAVVGLISTVLGSTVLGALISLGISWMNNRHQSHREEQKFAAQQEKERRERLREKLEEAHQLLSKIRTDTTPQASHLMRSTGTTLSNEQHQKSYEDVRRLLMIADLYLPQLQEPVKALEGLMNSFWLDHQNVMFLEKVEDPARFKDDRDGRVRELSKTSRELGLKVLEAQNKLREVATLLSVADS